MAIPLGEIIYASVKPMFKIYFILALGFYLAKRNILTVATCRDISDAIVTVFMPCLIFNKIVTNIVSSDIKNIGIIFFEGTLLFATGALFALAIFYLCNSPKAWFGGLISVGLFPNISDLPIAYLQTLSNTGALFTEEEGAKGVAYVCIFLGSQVFYQFSLGLFRLVRYDFRDQLAEKADAEAQVQKQLESMDHTMGSLDMEESPESKLEKTLDESKDEPLDGQQEKDLDNDPAHQAQSWPAELLSDSSSVGSKDGDDAPLENTHQPSELQQHDEFLLRHAIEPITSNPRSSLSMSSLYASSANNIERRRSALATSSTNYYSLNPVGSRTVDLRNMKSQDIQDVINEYSEFDRLKSNDAGRVPSIASEAAIDMSKPEPEGKPDESRLRKVGRLVLDTLRNFKTPNSLSLIVSVIIAMAPPLKALFVKSKFYIPNAPDQQPPLSFVMDLTGYVGAASVPLGLLLLGTTIARLQVKSIIPGFWKTVVAITACRLILMPIFGVGLTTGLRNAGWFAGDRLIQFVSVLEFGLPNATALVYFTAFYTDPTSSSHVQMDCLALCLILQYAILFITLPFLVTFTLVVSLGY